MSDTCFMRPFMFKSFPLWIGVAVVLAACQPTTSSSVSVGFSSPVFSVGTAPPPGRTEAERAARRKYYQGPRGDEW